MSLVFENELEEMTAAATEYLQSGDLPYYIAADVLLYEVPYYGFRTDIVSAQVDEYALERREGIVGHQKALPDERKYRKSYRELQRSGPMTRSEWIHDDSTYASEQTSRETWDWLAEHGFLVPAEGKASYQQTIAGDPVPKIDDDTPAVAVQVPDCVTLHALELKQRDHQTALRQAARADCYAEYRTVVMDDGQIDGALERKREFADAGVGLASLDEDGLEMYLNPDHNTPPQTPTRQLVNERVVQKYNDE